MVGTQASLWKLRNCSSSHMLTGYMLGLLCLGCPRLAALTSQAHMSIAEHMPGPFAQTCIYSDLTGVQWQTSACAYAHVPVGFVMSSLTYPRTIAGGWLDKDQGVMLKLTAFGDS